MADAAVISCGDTRNGSARGLAVTYLVLAVAGISESAILAAAYIAAIGPAVVLAAHALVVAAIAVLRRAPILSGRDGGIALIGFLATLATGPFGALGTLFLPALAAGYTESQARLDGWYRRIAMSSDVDDFTRLTDRVSIGRAGDLQAPPPEAFDTLFRSGSITNQQTALGIIARHFHLSFLPVLQIALKSPEPIIRVQAAAVAARIRPMLESQIEQHCARAADVTLSSAGIARIAQDLGAAAESSLLDDGLRARAAAVQGALLQRTFGDLGSRALRGSASVSPEVADLYGAHLLASGRLADFRALRFALRRPLAGRYRHRLVQARALPGRVEVSLRTVRR